MKYQPLLDGFRGLCITAVFLCHASFLACGWVGVQAFFVLSGYLITNVLFNAKKQGIGPGLFFKNFYARRALRIFPVYLVYLGTVAVAPHIINESFAETLRAHNAEHIPYLVTYTYNFYRVGSGPGSPFYGHLWSLSIEEQFYLLWPICLFLLSRQHLAGLCKLLIVSGPIVRIAELAWFQNSHPDSADAGRVLYFLSPSYLDAFALGALLNFRDEDALVRSLGNLPMRWILVAIGLVSLELLILGFLRHVDTGPLSLGWPIYMPHFYASIWGYTLLNFAFFVALSNIRATAAVTGRSFVQRLGKVSYGFYIFHLPILWLAYTTTGVERGRYTLPSIVVTAVAFLLTWFVAEVSFRCLELPMLNLKKYFRTTAFEAKILNGRVQSETE